MGTVRGFVLTRSTSVVILVKLVRSDMVASVVFVKFLLSVNGIAVVVLSIFYKNKIV